MYQPYPAGGPPPVPQQPPRPVMNAVKLMYVGAGLEVLGLVLNLVAAGSGGSSNAASGIVGSAIGAGLWLWMAAANKAGRNWARITSTVLFGLDCLFLLIILIGASTLISLAGGAAVAVVVASIVVWLIGLGAIVLLWQRESSDYFAAVSGG